MTTDADDKRHLRVGPGMDVAPCGARGMKVKFTRNLAQATCSVCVEKRTASTAVRVAKKLFGYDTEKPWKTRPPQ